MVRATLFVFGLAVIVASVALVNYIAAGCLAGVFLCGLALLLERAHLDREAP